MKDPKSVKNDKQALRVLGLEASISLTLPKSDKGVRLCSLSNLTEWLGEEVRSGCETAVEGTRQDERRREVRLLSAWQFTEEEILAAFNRQCALLGEARS